MGTAANDFLSKLIAIFRLEADEHLRSMTTGLLTLEKVTTTEERQPLLERVFRGAYSLKGAAQVIDLMEVEMICQSVESIFAQLKWGALPLSAEGFGAVRYALGTVEALLNAPQEPHAAQVSDAVHRLTAVEQEAQRREATPITIFPQPPTLRVNQPPPAKSSGEQVAKPASLVNTSQQLDQTSTPKPATGETIRVSTQKLDSLFLQAEEMLTVKLSIHQHANDLQEMATLLVDWKKEWTKISGEVRKLQRAIEDQANKVIHSTSYLQTAPTLVEFLYWNERQLNELETRLHGLVKVIESDQQTIGALVDNLLEDTKRVLMFPFSSLLKIFPKMVRDLSRLLGKEVELTIHGGEVEIDKRILEELKTPLIHLLRNSLDHGIETPEARVRQGKLTCGSLRVSVTQTGGSSVEILVSDDGAGIDAATVKQAAVKKGLLAPQAVNTLDEQAAIDLIFRSEVTTSPIVTDIAGRGLGMAIVREKVENLGGQLSVETHLHQGTTFRILLPLTLATLRSVFVRAADSIFAVPTTHIERVVRLEPHEIITLEGKHVILLDGRPIAFVSLDELLQVTRKKQSKTQETTVRVALIFQAAETRVACCVDEVLNEQEVLFKQLGLHLAQVPNVAGATVLGSGHVVPILHIPDLLKSITTGRAQIDAR
jgi:two-component system chemotaxis sensor kinase CheA